MILTPKAPFREWLRSHLEKEPGGPDEELVQRAGLDDRTAYLIPDYYDDREARAILQEFYDLLFEGELEAWYTDESMWPERRDFSTFSDWFDVEFLSLVVDTWDHPLQEE